jgi:hypothetical protein
VGKRQEERRRGHLAALEKVADDCELKQLPERHPRLMAQKVQLDLLKSFELYTIITFT